MFIVDIGGHQPAFAAVSYLLIVVGRQCSVCTECAENMRVQHIAPLAAVEAFDETVAIDDQMQFAADFA
ncbi:hypothetical protein ACFFJ4_02450 [Xanthomonas dyei]|nr:hypothetical protein [Xanthomonas dyei]PPU59291.1 hypothetical protein XdyCFBP7245_02475 [Xanthomonas dyei]